MTAINHLNNVANTSELPTVNNATLTIQRNGTTIDTFTANDATNTTANIAAVTSVATGGGLTGGTITNTGTISHADTSSQGTISNNGQFINGLTLDTYGHVTGFTRAAAGGGVPSGGVTGTVITNIGYNPGNVSLGNANPSVAGTSGSFDAGSPLVLNFSRSFGGVNSGHSILTGTWRPTNSRARYGGNTFTYDTWIRVS